MGKDYLAGLFTLAPSSGAPGAVVTAAAVTPCVNTGKQVGQFAAVLLVDAAELNDENSGLVVEQVARTSESGGWTTTMTVPKTAKNGDTFVVFAACFAGANSSDPFLVYAPEKFVVAPPARTATPVTGKPAFTG